jgi:hypothetical protein
MDEVDVLLPRGVHVAVGLESHDSHGEGPHSEALFGLEEAYQLSAAELVEGLRREGDSGGGDVGVALKDMRGLDDEDLSICGDG